MRFHVYTDFDSAEKIRAFSTGEGHTHPHPALFSFPHTADLLRGINDPEHPLTLEELNVIQQSELKWGYAGGCDIGVLHVVCKTSAPPSSTFRPV
jgi:hypothetical protein